MSRRGEAAILRAIDARRIPSAPWLRRLGLPGLQRRNPALYRCPYQGCGFRGSDEEVDDHRTSGVHDREPQAGSNLR